MKPRSEYKSIGRFSERNQLASTSLQNPGLENGFYRISRSAERFYAIARLVCTLP